MKNYISYFAILLTTLVLTQTAVADVKIKTRQTMSGQTSENTTYIKGKRQRSEMMNGQMVSITQCDLRRDVQLMPQGKVYMLRPFDDGVKQEKPSTTQTKTVTKNENGGTVTMTITTKDTGERKQMFGYTAKHLIITTETESTPDACQKTKTKMEADGWYIDAEWYFQCERGVYNYSSPNQSGGCRDKYDIKQIGTAKRGYPVYEKMTMFDESGKETYSFVQEVVELSKATLNAALFEIPSDYREVKDQQELYASMSGAQSSGSNNSSSASNSGADSGLSSTVKSAASQPQAQPQVEVGAKKEGTIRLGLASVKTGSVGDGLNASELASAVQNTMMQYLKTPNVEVVQIEAKLASAIDEEAKEKECDYVIYLNVSHKKGGGGFGMFKAIAPVLGNVVPMSGTTAGVVASSTIYTAASMSQNIKAKDELTLDVKLNSPGNATPVLIKQVKAKAKSGGEDIISPLIEQAAQAIIDAAKK